MEETTIEDRKKELRALLDQLSAHPEKGLLEQRKRVAVLQNMLAAHEKAQG